MIKLERVSPEQMLRNQENWRRKHAHAEPAPKVLNLGPALALDEPELLQWRGAEFYIRLISYHEALRLQRAVLTLERFGAKPPATLEQIDELERFLGTLPGLFYSFLDSQPPDNPFVDLLPPEVGELVAFFSVCLMKQAARYRRTVQARTSTTSMH